MRRFYTVGLTVLVALSVSVGVCDAARKGNKARSRQRLPIHKTSLIIMPFDYKPFDKVAVEARMEAETSDGATTTSEAKAVETDTTTTVVSAVDVGFAIAVGLRDALAGSDQYSVFVLSDKLPSIRRAIELDSSLKKSEIRPPFSGDTDRVLKIGRLLAADLVISGSLDTLTVDAAKKTGRAALSAQLVEVKTGRLVKVFVMVQGTVPSQSVATGEDELRALAVASAVQELKAQFVGAESGDVGTGK